MCGKSLGVQLLVFLCLVFGLVGCTSTINNSASILLAPAGAQCKPLFQRRAVRLWIWDLTGDPFTTEELGKMQAAGSVRITERVGLWDGIYYGLVLFGFVSRTVEVEGCGHKEVKLSATKMRAIRAQAISAESYRKSLERAIAQAAGARGMELEFASNQTDLTVAHRRALMTFAKRMRSAFPDARLDVASLATGAETADMARKRALAVRAVLGAANVSTGRTTFGVISTLPAGSAATGFVRVSLQP